MPSYFFLLLLLLHHLFLLLLLFLYHLFVLQDGALLANNPCAIALHEAQLLWGRHTPIQCVISLGTGLYGKRWMKDKDGPCPVSSQSTSLREKLTKVVASATDTEGGGEGGRGREG